MSEAIGSHAMILAAGFGVRMRPLTNDRPKPLIEVAGKALIDYGLDRLREAGVQKAVVNGHYRAEQILHWSQRRSAACAPPGMMRQWIAFSCFAMLTAPSATTAGGTSNWGVTDGSPVSRDRGLLPISAAISCILAFLPALL